MEDGEINKQENEVLLGIVEELRERKLDLETLLRAIGDRIVNHSKAMENPYQPKNILESRFTSPEQAYKMGMTSCGAMTNIGAFILRDLGYEVRLIHGSLPKSRNHAWMKIKEGDNWNEYDLTGRGRLPRKGRVIKNECSDWEEIKDVIEAEHGVNVHKD